MNLLQKYIDAGRELLLFLREYDNGLIVKPRVAVHHSTGKLENTVSK